VKAVFDAKTAPEFDANSAPLTGRASTYARSASIRFLRAEIDAKFASNFASAKATHATADYFPKVA